LEMEKKKSKRTQGYTLIELIAVLAIMAILGTMLVSMLNMGVKFYRNANTTMENQSDARLAIAYITVKIRQNDVAGGIAVISERDSFNNPIEVLRINDASTPGNTFWIYYDANTDKLREQSGNTGFNPVLANGIEISELSYLKIEQFGANLRFRVKSMDNTVDLTQEITLRSP